MKQSKTTLAPSKKETAVLRNVRTNDLYRHIEGTTFENIRTGGRGEVDAEKAKDIFVINIAATMIFNEFPLVEEMVRLLDLKIEPQK